MAAVSPALSGAMSPAEVSLDAIYQAHVDYVWRALRRLGVPSASLDDAVQDVFVAIHRRLGDFEGRSSLRSWVFGFALRVARDHRRRDARKGGLLPLSDQLPAPPESGPLVHAERAEAARILQALLDTMDDERREVFVLMEIEQLTAPEVAEILSTKLNTVYSRLRVARQDFERALARHHAIEARSRR